jgi:hypothetical protein
MRKGAPALDAAARPMVPIAPPQPQERGMKKFLLACAIILGLAAVGMVVNFKFNPISVQAQPAPQPP